MTPFAQTPIIIFVLAFIAIASLGLLAWKNIRAFPIGLLFNVVGFLIVFGGLAVGLSGMSSPSQQFKTSELVFGVGVILALVALGALCVKYCAPTGPKRLVWSVISIATWSVASFAGQPVISYWQDEQATRASIQKRNTADSIVTSKRQELVDDPQRRPFVFQTVIRSHRPHREYYTSLVDTVAWFGDMVHHPDSVTIWAIQRLPSHVPWAGQWREMSTLYHIFNSELLREGYPTPVSMGVAAAQSVDSAGGIEQYLGKDGRNYVPQFPAGMFTPPGNYPPDSLRWPQRRSKAPARP